MTAPVLADALGPRAKRRVLIASVVSAVVLAAVLAQLVSTFADAGQLEGRKWRYYLQPGVIEFLAKGLQNTLKAAVVAMALALVIGGLMALGRLARNRPVRWLAGAYVELFRAVPLVVLILFSFLALPTIVDDFGIHLDTFRVLVLALVAYNSAVLGEIFRAGILSLDRGQSEAASAIGLTYWQSMRIVIVPQALRRMIPAIVSQLVTLLKDTALGFVISYEELLRRATIAGDTSKPKTLLQAYLIVAAIYIVVNFALSRLARWLEVRQRRRYNAAALGVSGVEDLAVMDAHAGSKV